jgi:hypothetical protein
MSSGSLEEQIQRASEVQAKYADILMSKPHVVGVGVGFAQQNGERTPTVALVVMVDEKIPLAQLALDDVIPSQLDGVRVDVQSTGGFTAGPASPTDSGFSAGPADVTDTSFTAG